MRKTVDKPRASGSMSEAQYVTFVKGHLRKASRWWKPISETLKKSRVSRGMYKCNGCEEVVTASIIYNGKRVKNIYIDHIDPIVDVASGFTNWDSFVNNLFCEEDNLQALCHRCHNLIKTKEERQQAASIKTRQKDIRRDYPDTYHTWSNMNDRCHKPKATGFKYYGGKGIEVCERWRRDKDNPDGLNNFVEDMGHRPNGRTLDRIDYTKGYFKDNCRWSTSTEQARNTSSNNWIEWGGENKILQEWGEDLGIKPNSILTRLRRGWSVGQALGFEEKPKEFYSGRLTQDDLIFIQDKLNEGWSQVKIGEELEIDSSQISRICKKFNIKKAERELSKQRKKNNNA